MTTASRLGDTLRCVLANAPGGLSYACPAEVVHGARPLRRVSLWQQSLYSQENAFMATRWNGLRFRGLASCRMLSGPRSWQVDRLHVAGDLTVALELLEDLSREAGEHGAERLFLRVPEDSRIARLAQRTGFFSYFGESHLRGRIAEPQGSTPGPAFSPYEPQNEHALFQLYCATTPQPVRSGAGMTFDQWRDSREGTERRQQGWTVWEGGRLAGWLGIEHVGGVNAGRLLAPPDRPELARSLLDVASREQGFQSWLVPDFQEGVAKALLDAGLCESGRYLMLIKALAAPVAESRYSLVEA